MAALDDDFNTPEALAIMHGWRNHDLVRRGARALRARRSCRVAGGADGGGRSRPTPAAGARGRDFGEADRLRGEIESAGWIVRDVDDGFRLVPR